MGKKFLILEEAMLDPTLTMNHNFVQKSTHSSSSPEVPPSLQADLEKSEVMEVQEIGDVDQISQEGSTSEGEQSITEHQIYIANLHAG